jgi:hypothetical protein
MGFIELVAQHVSIKAICLVTLTLWVARMTINRIREHRKIKSMGNYGHALQPRLPFGKPSIHISLLLSLSSSHSPSSPTPSSSSSSSSSPLTTRLTSSQPHHTGIDFIYYGVRSTIAHKNLELWRDMFFANGTYTCEMRILNERVVLTVDPDNVKAVLATQFHDFGKGPDFKREWSELLGDSIFTTDGAQWHDSRQLLRPQFTRERLSDLHCFETHVQALFKAMANGGPLHGEGHEVDLSRADGRRLDISELFYRYTLDVATDFLLGSDVKSLSYVVRLQIPPPSSVLPKL